MKMQNTIHTLIALFLVSSIFFYSALTESCFCGSACSHALRLTEKAGRYFPFHMRCSCYPCESCDLEKGQTLKAKSTACHMLSAKILASMFIPSDLLDDPPTIPVFKYYDSVIVSGILQSPPIFLQQLTLLI